MSSFADRAIDEATVLALLKQHGVALQGHPRGEAVVARALRDYLELVDTWNRRQNLTGAVTDAELLDVLLGDAAAIHALVPSAPATFVDVGAGAGAPALPLMLLWPETRATLVEPLRKRVTFLRLAAGTLGLGGRVRVLEQSLDRHAPAIDGAPFSLALSRATFAPEEWLPLGMALAETTLVLGTARPAIEPGAARLIRERQYALASAKQSRWIGCYERVT